MKRKITVTGIVIGAILALGPVWGLLATVVGMQRAFSVLAGSGISDPLALSSSSGAVLSFQYIGFMMCPVGIALCIFCTIRLQALSRQPPPLPAPGGPADFRE